VGTQRDWTNRNEEVSTKSVCTANRRKHYQEEEMRSRDVEQGEVFEGTRETNASQILAGQKLYGGGSTPNIGVKKNTVGAGSGEKSKGKKIGRIR